LKEVLKNTEAVIAAQSAAVSTQDVLSTTTHEAVSVSSNSL